jgi:outer membrane lipoprotein-sorting protein
MILALVLAQALSAKQLLNDAWSQFHNAESMTMTMVITSEEHLRGDLTSKFFWRKGGFLRIEADHEVDVSDTKAAYSYRTDKKMYQVEHPAPADLELVLGQIGIHAFHAPWPVIGNPTPTVWHGFKTIRIELDARKDMTPETKLYVFVNPSTHLPIGVSANLGSETQVMIFKDVKINPTIPHSAFQFTPPKGWKQVTVKASGRN